MTVAADLMTRNVLTVAPDMPVCDVAELMLKHKVTSLPVVDADQKLVGIVSEGDFVRSASQQRDAHRSWWLTLLTGAHGRQGDVLSHGQCPVHEVMSKDVLLASEGDGLGQLIELLSRRRVKRLPVVKDGRLTGIVSRVDILKYLAATRHFRQDGHRAAV
jgi:CBS domain-containing protein